MVGTWNSALRCNVDNSSLFAQKPTWPIAKVCIVSLYITHASPAQLRARSIVEKFLRNVSSSHATSSFPQLISFINCPEPTIAFHDYPFHLSHIFLSHALIYLELYVTSLIFA